jgi:hypothetical protein
VGTGKERENAGEIAKEMLKGNSLLKSLDSTPGSTVKGYRDGSMVDSKSDLTNPLFTEKFKVSRMQIK